MGRAAVGQGAGARRVVYTCHEGAAGRFADVAYERDGRTDFVCFTDDPGLGARFWDVVCVGDALADCRALPHRFLPDHRISLFVGAGMRLTRRPRFYFRQMAEAGVAVMAGGGVLLRRHHDPGVIAAMEEWHALGGDPAGLAEVCARRGLAVGTLAEGLVRPDADPGAVLTAGGITVAAEDKRGRQLLAQGNHRLNEPSFVTWSLLLAEGGWSDIVDVGANYGEMLYGADLPAGARVWAVEPNPRIFPLLEQNLRAAGIGARCLRVALSDRGGEAVLSVHRGWSGLSTLEPVTDASAAKREQVAVPVLTLDEVLAEGAGAPLLKVDVEGHEIAVLTGALGTLARADRFAAMIEVAHLDAAARGWLLERFRLEVCDTARRRLLAVEPPTVARLADCLAAPGHNALDVVLRPLAQGHNLPQQ